MTGQLQSIEKSFSNADLNDPMFMSVINKIDGQVGVLKGKDLYWWNRFIPSLEKHHKVFNKTRADILNRHAVKDDKGNIKFKDLPNGQKGPDLGDNEEAAEAEFADLIDTEFSIRFRGLSNDAIDNLAEVLAPKEIRQCDKLKWITTFEGDHDVGSGTSQETVAE